MAKPAARPKTLRGGGRAPSGENALHEVTPDNLVAIAPVDDEIVERIFRFVAPAEISATRADELREEIRDLKTMVTFRRKDGRQVNRYSIEPPEAVRVRFGLKPDAERSKASRVSKVSAKSRRARGRMARRKTPYTAAQMAALGALGLASVGATALTFNQQLMETAGDAKVLSYDWMSAATKTSILNLVAIFGLLGGAYRLRENVRDEEMGQAAAKLALLGVALGAVYQNVSVTDQYHASAVQEGRASVYADYDTKKSLAADHGALSSAIEADSERLADLRKRESGIAERYDGEPRLLQSEEDFIAALKAMPRYSAKGDGGRKANPTDTQALEKERADARALAEIRDEIRTLDERLSTDRQTLRRLSDQLKKYAHVDLDQPKEEVTRSDERRAIAIGENLGLQLWGYFGLLVIGLVAGGRRTRDNAYVFEDPSTGQPILKIAGDGAVSFFAYDETSRLRSVQHCQLDPKLVGRIFDNVENPEPADIAQVVERMNAEIAKTGLADALKISFGPDGLEIDDGREGVSAAR